MTKDHEANDLAAAAPVAERPLSEKEERLLSTFNDGECGPLASFQVRRILKRSTAARDYIHYLRSSGVAMRSSRIGEQIEVDLWDRISARIDNEKRTEVFLGARESRSRGPFAHAWRSRLSWGVSGAAVASACSLLLIQSGALRGATPAQIAPAVSGVRSPVVSAVSYDASSGGSSVRAGRPLEMDWLRSEGRLRLLQEPGEQGSIIWVKPRAGTPEVTSAADFGSARNSQRLAPQRLSRRFTRSNTHIPVAIPASER